jgi:hypothetical protein
MKTLLTPIPVILSGFMCVAQNVTYTQSNKEIEYHYGVIADEELDQISDIEKIKYELRYMERSVTKKIDDQFNSYLEIVVDSNGYEQPWMELAKRFSYSPAGIDLYDKNNLYMETIPYTSDQEVAKDEVKDDIRQYGFHPGITAFPEFMDDEIQALSASGILVQKREDGTTKVDYPGNQTETYDPNKLTIVSEWYDEDGNRTLETMGYEPYLNNMGYLLRISKTEKFLHSVNGPCITEVKLKYFSDYEIADLGHLIDRAMHNIDSIMIYPNPNDGVFTVEIQTANQSPILSASIINLLTGEDIPVPMSESNTLLVNKPDLLPGNYVFRVTTSQTVISAQFIKQ